MKTTHLLEKWRRANGVSRVEFSRRIGIKGKMTVYTWERMGIIPSIKNSMAVERETKGEVTANYMLQLGSGAHDATARN
jgi:hypothetical protein